MKRGQLIMPGAERCMYPFAPHACPEDAVIDAGRVHKDGLASTPLCAAHAKKLGYQLGDNAGEKPKRPSARRWTA
jgi:hypothetical protein